MFPSPAPSEYKDFVLLIAEISGYAHFSSMKNLQLIHAREIVAELLDAVVDAVRLPVKLGRVDGDTIFLSTETGNNLDIVINDVAIQSMRLVAAFVDRQSRLIGQADGGCPCPACRDIGDLKLNLLIYAGEGPMQTIAERLEQAGSDLIQIHRLHKAAGTTVGPPTSAPYLRLVFNADLMTGSGPVQAIICSSVPLEHLQATARPLTRLNGMREAVRLYRAHRIRKKQPSL